MTWAERVQLAQLLSALCWGGAAAYFAFWSWRTRHRPNPLNVIERVLAFTGVTQAGFTVRWYVWPGAVHVMGGEEVSAWLGLYLLSSVEAVALVAMAVSYRRINRA